VLLLLSRQNMVSWVCTQPIVALLELAVAICVIIDRVCVLSGFTNPAVDGVIFSRTTCIADGDEKCKLVVEQ